MPRRPRIHQPGGLYHVILRGNNGQRVFSGDYGYKVFLSLLTEGTKRFGYRLHAFCLMPNHVHLAVQVGEQPLSKAMQNAGFRHALRTNRLQGSTGHLFQGRYKAILVADTAYALELVRYIHLNPVRAGLAADPADWRWSSHRAYLGIDSWPFLTSSWVLEMLGDEPSAARARYVEFVRAALGPTPGEEGDGTPGKAACAQREDEAGLFHPTPSDWSCPIRPPSLPGPLDSTEGLAHAPFSPGTPPRVSLEDVVRAVCGDYRITPARLLSRSRARPEAEARYVILRIALAYRSATVNAAASLFGRDPSAFSHGLRRLEEKLERNPALKRRVAALTVGIGSPAPSQEKSNSQA